MRERPRSQRGGGDALRSWNDTGPRKAILEFVRAVTTPGHPDFVPIGERIATFDNDGTLWCEQPVPVQAFFAMDRLRQLAEQDPQLKEQQPYKAFLEHDTRTLATYGKRELMTVIARSHAGMTPEEFDEVARAWLAEAQHPTRKRLFTDLVYQPQLELLAYLQQHGFHTYIVSGGGIEFLRAFAQSTYGIPPEQVIGSSNRTKISTSNGSISLVKQSELRSFDDRDEKPVNVELHIGRRPILAFGNSDGDLRMLQYTASAGGRRLMLLLHHDDGEREVAYDKDFRISPLDEALQAAREQGWTVVSMRQDWRNVFPLSLQRGEVQPSLGLAAD